MNYPIEILPKENLKRIECDLSEQYLVRHAPMKDIYDEEVELIYAKAVCEPSVTHMPDLSTSLLNVFVVDNVFIEIINNELVAYCAPDHKSDIPIYTNDFILNINRGYWFIQIAKIQNLEANYKIADDGFTAVCKVCHTPMKWNFWHFSIRWYLIEKECFWNDFDKKELKKGWSERLAHETRSIIRMHCQIQEPPIDSLDKSCYSK